MDREVMLARTLVAMADTLVDHFDVIDMLAIVADRCVGVFGATAAGVLLASPDGGLRFAASSSEELRLVELFVVQAREGPCNDCFQSGSPVINADLLETEGRWPNFAPRALEAGFRSVHTLPMRLRGETVGVLNLFQVEPGTFDEQDVAAAQALADMATISLLQARAARDAQAINEQLSEALNSRISIEQAKGIAGEALKLDMDEAFDRLRRYARAHNAKLSDVASSIVSGSLSATQLRPITPPKGARAANAVG